MPRDFFKESFEIANWVVAAEQHRRSKLPLEEQRRLRRQDLLIDIQDTATGFLAVGSILALWSLPLVTAYMLGRRNRTR